MYVDITNMYVDITNIDVCRYNIHVCRYNKPSLLGQTDVSEKTAIST